MKNRKTAAVLAFFLGGIGGHHWYLGNLVRGFVYLFLCWTFIPVIISFVEFIILISSSDASFNEKYNQIITRNENIAALKNLHDLKNEGAISDTEFAVQKKKLIS